VAATVAQISVHASSATGENAERWAWPMAWSNQVSRPLRYKLKTPKQLPKEKKHV